MPAKRKIMHRWSQNKDPLLKPFEHGFKREIVLRSDSATRGRDVYYISPKGKKLRSMPDVFSYLRKRGGTELREVNFTFCTCPIYNPPYEVVRQAKPRSMLKASRCQTSRSTLHRSTKKSGVEVQLSSHPVRKLECGHKVPANLALKEPMGKQRQRKEAKERHVDDSVLNYGDYGACFKEQNVICAQLVVSITHMPLLDSQSLKDARTGMENTDTRCTVFRGVTDERPGTSRDKKAPKLMSQVQDKGSKKRKLPGNTTPKAFSL
ncbi:uncharacterized protein LOC135396654 isoform X2 [Ornithodoros turicata]|uniref:uncharacterized protein LOC135396654 isoform X2 n=1 Tax=Ornithodoros turicata TaxID=34597 RepID=UPI003139CFDA